MKNNKIKIMFFIFALTLVFNNIGLVAKAEENDETDELSNITTVALGDTIAQAFPDPNMAQAVAHMVSGSNVNAIITQTMIDSTTVLNLWSGNIDSIEGIEIFSNLQKLDISTNNLTTLPDSIASLTSLRILDFTKNKFTVFPEILCSMPNITNLIFWNNQISTVPESIGNMSGLKSLNFAFNKITTLPKRIGDLSNLETLSLWSTSIQTLPESITKLSNLKNFFLYNTQLISLSQSQFDYIASVASYVYGQRYNQTLSSKGTINCDYSFDGLPAYEQFPNYGVAFTFTLKSPDGTTLIITPTITNGLVTIDRSLLTQEGDYVLTANGTGGILEPVLYTHSFSIEEGVIDYMSAVADGNANTVTSSKITITLSKDIIGLNKDNICLSNNKVKVTNLSSLNNGVYELSIAGIWDEGTLVDVSFVKGQSGGTSSLDTIIITPDVQTVVLHKAKKNIGVITPNKPEKPEINTNGSTKTSGKNSNAIPQTSYSNSSSTMIFLVGLLISSGYLLIRKKIYK